MATTKTTDDLLTNASIGALARVPKNVDLNMVNTVGSYTGTLNQSDGSFPGCTLDELVEQAVREAERSAYTARARIRDIVKYRPVEAKEFSTELIKDLFDLADREVIANLLMGNEE